MTEPAYRQYLDAVSFSLFKSIFKDIAMTFLGSGLIFKGWEYPVDVGKGHSARCFLASSLKDQTTALFRGPALRRDWARLFQRERTGPIGTRSKS